MAKIRFPFQVYVSVVVSLEEKAKEARERYLSLAASSFVSEDARRVVLATAHQSLDEAANALHWFRNNVEA